MPDSSSFDYWYGGRPVVRLSRDTGQFDYWYPATAAEEEEPPPDPPPSTDTLVFGLGAMR